MGRTRADFVRDTAAADGGGGLDGNERDGGASASEGAAADATILQSVSMEFVPLNRDLNSQSRLDVCSYFG